MIKYNLKCKNNHEFESWFSDSIEFERLKNQQLLECIYCSSKKISKSIMSPNVSIIQKNKNLEKFIQENGEIFEIKKNLLDFTKKNLTTEILAKYTLKENY